MIWRQCACCHNKVWRHSGWWEKVKKCWAWLYGVQYNLQENANKYFNRFTEKNIFIFIAIILPSSLDISWILDTANSNKKRPNSEGRTRNIWSSITIITQLMLRDLSKTNSENQPPLNLDIICQPMDTKNIFRTFVIFGQKAETHKCFLKHVCLVLKSTFTQVFRW